MQAVASLRHYRGSAQKVRLVADLIRLKPVGHAVATLKTTRKACSDDLLKLVESALANAQQNESGVDADSLVISSIQVDGAGRKPLQKNSMIRSISNYKKRFARPRFMSGPQGRMWLVPRPFCHVTVILSDEPEARKAAGLKAEAPKPVARKGRTSRVAAAAAAVSAAGTRRGAKKVDAKAAAPVSAAPKKSSTKKKSADKPAKSGE